MHLILLFLGACTQPGEEGANGKPWGNLACRAKVSETVATVIILEWDTPEAGTSRVEFGETEDYGMTTPAVTGESVRLPLVGMPGDTDVYWRAFTDTPDGGGYWCEGMTTTGSVPSEVPRVSVDVDEAGRDDAPFVIGAWFFGAGGRGAQTKLAAYRRDGEIVWYFLGEEDATSMDLHYALDGGGLLFNQFAGQMGGELGSIHRVSWEGEVVESWDTPGAHHMFTELPSGVIAFQRVDTRTYDDGTGTQAWVGDAIAEISPGGNITNTYSTWDTLTPTMNGRAARSIYDGLDWTHGNNLVYSALDQTWLLSLGHAADVLVIDRATGVATSVWGPDGVPADPPFDYNHDVHWLPNGNLLMFMTEDGSSGAVEYARDGDGLTEVWRSTFEDEPFALGQARRLPNGNTFINGGALHALREETPDGELVWQMAGEDGGIFAQFQLVSNLYTGELQ